MVRHYPVNPERTAGAVQAGEYAVSSNDARPNQCCIEFLKDKIIAVDGYRLAMSTDPAVNVEKPFYIPPEVMAELTMFKDRLHDLRWRGVGGGLKAKRCVCSPDTRL